MKTIADGKHHSGYFGMKNHFQPLMIMTITLIIVLCSIGTAEECINLLSSDECKAKGFVNISGADYFFGDDDNIKPGWNYVDQGWQYYDSDGILVKDFSDIHSLFIPKEVEGLKPTVFRGAGRDFVIECEKGSYAESMARHYGLQYDNGEKRVVGYEIRDYDQKTNWIIENYIDSGMSQREKARILHDWIVFNSTYDYSYLSGEGVLLHGGGVCGAHMEAYSDLLHAVGIETRALNSAKMNHSWNLVRIEDQWYHVDTTWDDPGMGDEPVISGYESYEHFLSDDSAISKNHNWEEDVQADKNNVGWASDGTNHYYYGDDGKRAVGFVHVPSRNNSASELKLYYFDTDGKLKMEPGWIFHEGHYYYMDIKGALLSGGKYVIEGETYEFDKHGILISDNPDEIKQKKAQEIKADYYYQLISSKTAAVFAGISDNKVTSITIPDTVRINGWGYKVTEIAENACNGLIKLTTVTIGKNVKKIGESAFSGCKKLQTLIGGKRVTTICAGAFSSCGKLNSIPEFGDLKVIGDHAFANCRSLKSFTLGKKMESIGRKAFNGCKNLETFVIRTKKLNDKNVGNNAFKDTPAITVIKCPADNLKAYKKLFLKKGVQKKTRFRKL